MPFSAAGCDAAAAVPSGLFPKNVDGRIETRAPVEGARHLDHLGSRTNFHLEGGKDNRPKAIKLQQAPDPLARDEIGI